MAESLRLRWGRPRIRGSIWTWHRADRIIEANLDPDVASVRITMREA